MVKPKLVTGEFYHIYNRGNNKRPIFLSHFDLFRFLQSMREFNTKELIGSIYLKSLEDDEFRSSTPKTTEKLVDFVCYCLNQNHFHILMQQLAENGIMKFMHKLGTGYTNFFNGKNKSSGSLFQGRYKAIHVDSNEYLRHLSVYINLNYKAHKLGSSTSRLCKSSWGEYVGEEKGFCNKRIILSQFKGAEDYKDFAEGALKTIKDKKYMEKSLALAI